MHLKSGAVKNSKISCSKTLDLQRAYRDFGSKGREIYVTGTNQILGQDDNTANVDSNKNVITNQIKELINRAKEFQEFYRDIFSFPFSKNKNIPPDEVSLPSVVIDQQVD